METLVGGNDLFIRPSTKGPNPRTQVPGSEQDHQQFDLAQVYRNVLQQFCYKAGPLISELQMGD